MRKLIKLNLAYLCLVFSIVHAFHGAPAARAGCASQLREWGHRLRHLRKLDFADRLHELRQNPSIDRQGIDRLALRFRNGDPAVKAGAWAELEMLELLSHSDSVRIEFPELRKSHFFETVADFELVFEYAETSRGQSVIAELKSLTFHGGYRWGRFRSEISRIFEKAAYQLQVTRPAFSSPERSEGFFILRVQFPNAPTETEIQKILEAVRQEMQSEAYNVGPGLRAVAVLGNRHDRQWLMGIETLDGNRILDQHLVRELMGAK